MLVVGLTGGIASGKSTISNYLARYGAQIIDADQIARQVVLPGAEAWEKIKTSFGSAVFREDQTLDRKKLGDIVFHDPDQRRLLNQIIHPIVIAKTKELIDYYAQLPETFLIVIDAPLLIEANMTSLVDEVWVIDVAMEEQIARVMARDRLTKEKAKKIISSQMPTKEKLKFADRIIDTNVAQEQTLEQVGDILAKIIGEHEAIKNT